MDIIRLDRSDLDDLRYFIRYVDEKGMTVQEVNEVLYYIGDKYGFDPLEHKINLMTGIVVPKQPYTNTPIPARRTPEEPQTLEPPSHREPLSPNDALEATEAMRAKAQEAADGLRTYRITGHGGAEPYAEPEVCETVDYAKELDAWILDNNLTYLEARTMIASLELKKRMSELHPERGCAPSPGKLAEFENWISYRKLSYFSVRMMIARLGQNGEKERLVAAVA